MKPPSVLVAVIVVVPFETATTCPSNTQATPGLELLQATPFSNASCGYTVAESKTSENISGVLVNANVLEDLGNHLTG